MAVLAGALLASAAAQESADKSKPQVKVNFLNVCTPSADEQKELGAALSRIPQRPRFAEDFEVTRGRTTITEPPIKLEGVEQDESAGPSSSRFVRMRREFSADAPLVSVQYSISIDEKNIQESLVFRSREAKDVIQMLLEDSVSAGSDPLQVLKSDTPTDRIRIERFGKPSVVLSRCPSADQKDYEPLFQQASTAMAHYRRLLGVRDAVPADLRRLGVGVVKPAEAAAKPKAVKHE